MINKVNVENFNKSIFLNKYKVFRVRKNIDITNIKDSKDIDILVYSITYVNDDIYVLTKPDIKTENLKHIFIEPDYSILTADINEIENYILINLLINSLPNILLTFNNLTANYYEIFKQKHKKTTISALNMNLNSSYLLSNKVVTFSHYTNETEPFFTKKQIENNKKGLMTHYKGLDNLWVLKTENPDYYIIANIYKKNNCMDYFDSELFEKTKTYSMYKLLESLNYHFKDFLKLAFVDDFEILNSMKERRILKENFFNNKENKLINIIINEEEAKKLFDKGLLTNTQFKFTISNTLNKDTFNINLIKDKKDYVDLKENDKYLKCKDCVIQNVIYNKKKFKFESLLEQCYLELLIKEEALNKKVSLISLAGEWSFYQVFNKDLYVMKIKNNEILSFRVFSLLDDYDENYILDLFRDENHNLDKTLKIIKHDSSIIQIKETNLKLLPNIGIYIEKYESLYSIDKNGKKVFHLQGEKTRNLYKELVDINTFEYENKKYYSVGAIGHGVQRKFAKAPSIREIIYTDFNLDDLWLFLKPNIFRINQYSATPYPFKLMKEVYNYATL